MSGSEGAQRFLMAIDGDRLSSAAFPWPSSRLALTELYDA